MSDFVRIRTENGLEATVGRVFAESTEGVQIIDAPATNGRGLPLKESRRDGRPVKPRTSVSKAASKKAASRSTPSEPGASTDDGAAVDQPQEA